MATYTPQDATGVLISDISKGTQTNDVKVTLDSESVTIGSSALPSGAATESTLSSVKTAVEAIQSTAGVKKITDALPAGTNLLGKVGIDQTTPGTTNAVVLKDTTGAELDYRQENENWNAADHGILVFGRDTESTPDKYRAINLNTEGDIYVDLSDINGAEPAVGSGAANTGTLRIIQATDSPDVTSLQVIDDWDESDRCKVNPIAGQAGVQGGSGAVTALTQRVVLATDQPVIPISDNSSTLSVDDGSGSLTVDAPVGTPVFVRASDGSAALTPASVYDLDSGAGNDYALGVSLRSVNSGGSLPLGDATTPMQVSLANHAANATAVKVNVASGGIASGAIASGAIASGAIASGAIAAGAIAAGNTSIATTEDTARAAGEHILKVGASRLDAPVANANVDADGDYTNLTVDNYGKLWVAGAAIEDAAETAGMSVMVAGAIRRDTCASSSGTTGDVSTVNTDANGALWVDPQGNVAHDTGDAGNPIKIGAKAETSTAGVTLVADGDRSDLYCDADGLLITKPYTANGDILVESVSNTDGAATALTVFGATANARNCITTITVINSHASTTGRVDIRDGTGGAVIWSIPLPANNAGHTVTFPVPLRQPTSNTALAFDVSAAISTVYLSFCGFKSKA